jgi:agmatinase
MSSEPRPGRPTDNAFLGPLKGGSLEACYAGALSFMRRRYSRDLAGVDVAVWGVPLDAAVSNRPGARFGPQAIRRASAILCGDPQYPFHRDPFAELTVIDYGDCAFDYGRHAEIPGAIRAQAETILGRGVHLVSLGGDHFVTWPLLQAHAARHGPLALVQLDAHQDTWDDDGDRLDHGTFVARAVRAGLIEPARSIQIGIRTHAPDTCGIEIVDGYLVQTLGIAATIERVLTRVGAGPAYLSVDIDCLDPAHAPGTGTPVAGGLSTAQALMLLRGLEAVDWRGMDVVEVAPAYDHADITAIAAAAFVQHYLGLIEQRLFHGRAPRSQHPA